MKSSLEDRKLNKGIKQIRIWDEHAIKMQHKFSYKPKTSLIYLVKACSRQFSWRNEDAKLLKLLNICIKCLIK